MLSFPPLIQHKFPFNEHKLQAIHRGNTQNSIQKEQSYNAAFRRIKSIQAHSFHQIFENGGKNTANEHSRVHGNQHVLYSMVINMCCVPWHSRADVIDFMLIIPIIQQHSSHK